MLERRFPVGPFQAPDAVDDTQVARWIDEIAELPRRLRAIVSDLDPVLLERP